MKHDETARPLPPDWKLERWRAGALPPTEARALADRLERDPALRARVRAMDAEDAATLAAYPPAAVAAEVARRAHLAAARDAARTATDGPASDGRAAAARRRRLWTAGLVGLPSAAALAAVVLVALPSFGPWQTRRALDAALDPAASAPLDTTRTKGLEPARPVALPPRLALFRKGPAGPEPLGDGAPAARGDVVQLRYHAGGRGFGAIVSIDGQGGVTLHQPSSDAAVPALVPADETTLGAAYELDDAPAYERFFLVTSATPFDVAQVLAAARRLAAEPTRARTAPLALPPAPAIAWHAVARVLAGGLHQLPPSARVLILAGALTGVALTLADRYLPRYRRFIPSATGFGLAFTLSFSNTLSMFLGALVALMLERKNRRLAETYIVPVSSGVIAAEGLVAIGLALYRAL